MCIKKERVGNGEEKGGRKGRSINFLHVVLVFLRRRRRRAFGKREEEEAPFPFPFSSSSLFLPWLSSLFFFFLLSVRQSAINFAPDEKRGEGERKKRRKVFSDNFSPEDNLVRPSVS